MLGRAWGIGRSLAMYHGIPGRHRRMAEFYAQFLSPGDLGFDIGAHVGSRVRAWRRLGVQVVAVEPQPDCLRVLRLLYGRDPEVEIVPKAVGAEAGRARLAISTKTPTVSSLSPSWIHEVAADRRFAQVRWNESVDVEVTTLETLVAAYGAPAFCKIDVEGFEVEVLEGLRHRLHALSFEYLPAAHDRALTAVERVRRLGDYEFNYSKVETMALAADDWLDPDGLTALLGRLRPLGRSGDVYARRRPGVSRRRLGQRS